MLNSALHTICEEHRSLAAVVRGLRHLVGRYLARTEAPDLQLLQAIIHYLDEFPQKLHHPKEDAYLFAALRQRTRAADAIILELSRQHLEECDRLATLHTALESLINGAADGLDRFALAVERYAEHVLRHMEREESSLLPLAQHYLTAEDWIRISEAFGTNGDPRFVADKENDYSGLFRRLLDLAATS